MKESTKRKFLTVLTTALVVGSVVANCAPKKKEDNSMLLLGALLLNQPQEPTYAVSMVGELRTKSNGTWDLAGFSGANDNEKRYYSARLMKLTSPNAILASGETIQQITSGADAKGKFSMSFKLTSLNAPITIVGEGLPNSILTNLQISGGNSVEGDKPANYTDRKGSFTFTLAGNLGDPTSLNQITNKVVTSDDFNADIIQVRVIQIGSYDIVSPTLGEQFCDGNRVSGSPQVKEGTISAAETWSGAILLRGTVFADAAITVQPGTVIFGARGSSLFVRGGHKLTAIGTATNPICWTSASSPGSRFPGDWGGIVTIGTAGASRTALTEGTTPQSYGGAPTNASNVNVDMAYNIIEFGGNEVAPGDELNNLSMYATYSKLSNVQTHRGLDDQFEQWGGRAEWNQLLATGGMDDDYDLDEGVTGTITNIIAHKYPAACGGSPSGDPHSFEMDGTHSGANNDCATNNVNRCTNVDINGFTLIGANVSPGEAMRLREGFAGTVRNGVAYNFTGNSSGQIVRGGGESGFPANNSTFNNVGLHSGKLAHTATTVTSATNVAYDINEMPIVSEGSTSDCGFGANKPDYRLKAAFTGRTGGATTDWYANWTVYRAR